MEPGVRNLAFLQLSTAEEECMQVEEGERREEAWGPGLGRRTESEEGNHLFWTKEHTEGRVEAEELATEARI